ncbi:MAG TPA: alkaline phosphatase family protein [Blastocatellia bacterium]|nr:alkaline phosphatase family protein [Blastocatellia bacterium]
MMKYVVFLLLLFMLTATAVGQAGGPGKTENVILITLDGARTQEVFGGLDLEVLKSTTKKGSVEDTVLYKKYYAETPEKRREKLMPFFWGALMKQHGSIAGNRGLGSAAMTTNKMWFSYPGYSEILTGQAHDDVINSNDKKRNPYTSALEFLKRKLKLDSKRVAAFASWDVMDFIAEHEAGSITSNAGYEPYDHPDPEIKLLGRLQIEAPTPWDSVRHDYYTFRFTMAHLKSYQPRVLYLSLGETDDWAHDGRYDKTLEALERSDRYLRELWEYLQSSERYKGKTSIIITVDHGRGAAPQDWRDHGEKVPEAQYIWMAFISPDSALRGEWKSAETIYQNQVAATLCRFLNQDYAENNPSAGKPIERLFVTH